MITVAQEYMLRRRQTTDCSISLGCVHPVWEEGYRDRFNGVARFMCPYSEGTAEYRLWNLGWKLESSNWRMLWKLGYRAGDVGTLDLFEASEENATT